MGNGSATGPGFPTQRRGALKNSYCGASAPSSAARSVGRDRLTEVLGILADDEGAHGQGIQATIKKRRQGIIGR